MKADRTWVLKNALNAEPKKCRVDLSNNIGLTIFFRDSRTCRSNSGFDVARSMEDLGFCWHLLCHKVSPGMTSCLPWLGQGSTWKALCAKHLTNVGSIDSLCPRSKLEQTRGTSGLSATGSLWSRRLPFHHRATFQREDDCRSVLRSTRPCSIWNFSTANIFKEPPRTQWELSENSSI